MKVGDKVIVVGPDLTDFEGVIVRSFPPSDLGVESYTVDLINKIDDLDMSGCLFEANELEVIS